MSRTRKKSPFKAYELDCQKRSWIGTNREVDFGGGKIKQMAAMMNLEGALWVMETSNQMRTFAYSSSPRSKGVPPWSAVSWSWIDMWEKPQYAPTGSCSAFFVNTETSEHLFVDIDMIVNRTTAMKKVANPVQLIQTNGTQWLSNWRLNEWWIRNHKDEFCADQLYIFWQPHSQCVNIIPPLI